MVYWISLKPGWKLQDVQAALNVVIAFLCAGGIFVLVRYCWLLAARRVTQQKDVPASSLLSLNTIGETIDVIWLLRRDLLSRRYHGLLLQCIAVMILTVAALMSGFTARFSTRNGTVVTNRMINGSIAQRLTGSIPFAEVETNATLYSLKNANFPQNQLLEYLPDLSNYWEYRPEQWNSSWHLDCAYVDPTVVPNVRATGNCTGLLYEVPQVRDNWKDWGVNDSWGYDFTGWRNNYTTYRDILIFSHGIEYGDSDPDLDGTWTSARVRTVALHLEGVPYNTSLEGTGCNFAEGPITRASYTSMTCKMTRDVAGKTKGEAYYGAYPDAFDVIIQATAYLQHYANNFRRESSREQQITVITGQEMARFYQAYMITKDTSTAPYGMRNISVHVEVAQISLATLVVCSVAAAIILFGLCHYWLFMFRHWSHMNKTPQSKLDWMLRTLRMDHEDLHHSGSVRQKLKDAMASGHRDSEVVPLTDIDLKGTGHDRKSVASSTVTIPTPEMNKGDDGFEAPVVAATFSGTRPGAPWFAQTTQYERVGGAHGHGRQGSFGLGLSYGSSLNADYHPVQERIEPGRGSHRWTGANQVDTTYDPGRW